MSTDQAMETLRQCVMITLMISAPILGVGLIVGLVISILQAVTQIQEQTLAFVPKLLAMAGATIALIPWIGAQLMRFAEQMFRT